MDESRKAFERALCTEYEWFESTLEMATFIGDDKTGYYIGGNYMYDGSSCSDALFFAWIGWKLAVAAGIKVKE
ncbi:TPA: hypothetical protein ACQTWV_000417 [Enterobacter roggenkampii]